MDKTELKKITVHTKKSRTMPGTYEGYILVSNNNESLYTVDTGIYRLNETDALHDAAWISEDYEIPETI